MLLLFLLLASVKSFSQQNQASAWGLIGLEMSSYTGDLSHYAQFNGSINAGFRLNHRENLNGQFTLMIGMLKGDNRELNIPVGSVAPNRFFKSSILEVSYQLHYHFYRTGNFSFYVSPGAGIMRFLPMDEGGTSLIDIGETRAENETYRNITLVLPLKLGGQYVFDNQFGINLEIGWHNPLTDYLDNISELGTGGLDNIFFVRVNLMVPMSFRNDQG